MLQVQSTGYLPSMSPSISTFSWTEVLDSPVPITPIDPYPKAGGGRSCHALNEPRSKRYLAVTVYLYQLIPWFSNSEYWRFHLIVLRSTYICHICHDDASAALSSSTPAYWRGSGGPCNARVADRNASHGIINVGFRSLLCGAYAWGCRNLWQSIIPGWVAQTQ